MQGLVGVARRSDDLLLYAEPYVRAGAGHSKMLVRPSAFTLTA